jgi:hypothetical protein
MSVVAAPAGVIGLLAVFAAGLLITHIGLETIVERKRGSPPHYWETRKEVGGLLDFLDKNNIKLSILGGIVPAAVVFYLLVTVSDEAQAIMWFVLTIIGILIGILTFAFVLDSSDSKAGTKTGQKPKEPPPLNRTRDEYEAIMEEARRKHEEEERERRKHRAEFDANMEDLWEKQKDIELIKDDLYRLFGMPDDQWHGRAILLANVLNRFFRLSRIHIREDFELVQQDDNGEIVEDVTGVIELDVSNYLVEIKWRKRSLSIQEVSTYLARMFNSGYPGGILISCSDFTQSAITTCEEALSQRTVVLCEMAEIVTLLEQNDSLDAFLKAKISAAKIDRNPLYAPLN